MARNKQDLIHNRFIFPIIISLSQYNKNSYQISKEISKAQSTVYEHLKNLEFDKMIISTEKNNKYKLNYGKINRLFFNFCINELKKLKEKDIDFERQNYFQEVEGREKPYDLEDYIDMIKEFDDYVEDNRYISTIFYDIFRELKEKNIGNNKKITLQDIFYKVYNSLRDGTFSEEGIGSHTVQLCLENLEKNYHIFADIWEYKNLKEIIEKKIHNPKYFREDNYYILLDLISNAIESYDNANEIVHRNIVKVALEKEISKEDLLNELEEKKKTR